VNERVWNFSAGPAALPLPVLERARDELLSYPGAGASVLEISHRSPAFDSILEEAETNLRELLGVPPEHRVLFLQGGASLQFSMIPQNLRAEGASADYVGTGEWATKAIKEAKKLGATKVVATAEATNYDRVPDGVVASPGAAYLHLTSNETIQGVQWHAFPETGDVPLVADMSSDIMSRPLDVSKFGLIYAGAQKNLGPSGVTLVIAKGDLLERAPDTLPSMLDYRVHVKNGSMYNTPPTFAIYMLRNVLDWIKQAGGLGAIAEANEKKAARLYGVIDASNGMYVGHAVEADRSRMNVPFKLADEATEKEFLAQAEKQGLVGLAGHRSVGGCRASIYNAMPLEGVDALASFMESFARRGA
jgi:phosphoserine aminotransferase